MRSTVGKVLLGIASFGSLLTPMSCGRLTTEPNGTVSIIQIDKEKSTGVHVRREEVISAQSQWDIVWQEINSNRSPRPSQPVVDFSRYVLVFVARGETGDACRDLVIDHVDLRNRMFD